MLRLLVPSEAPQFGRIEGVGRTDETRSRNTMAQNLGKGSFGCRGRCPVPGSSRMLSGSRQEKYEIPHAGTTGPEACTPAILGVPEMLPPKFAPDIKREEDSVTMLAGTLKHDESAMNSIQQAETLGANVQSVLLIGPDGRRRSAVEEALAGSPCRLGGQLTSYPDLDQGSDIREDIIILDLDSDVECALELVESICAGSPATVMVYSESFDSELMLRCMRAGAREFLTYPLKQSALTDAIVRASARRSAMRTPRKADGRLHVFCGAKGGTGVTTIATNFAVSAVAESGKKVLLIDLDLPLGDAALQLGVTAQYSTVDALQNSVRLDANFLSRLVSKHDSGLSLLPAPGSFVPYQLTPESVSKLIQVARQEFDIVVIDAGSRYELHGTSLFDPDAVVYLVTDVGVSELRNANRIVSELFPASRPKLEIILNRYAPTTLGVDDEHIKRALTRPAQWRIPEDKAMVREMQNTAMPLTARDTPVSRAIRNMARAACGLGEEPGKRKKIMGLF